MNVSYILTGTTDFPTPNASLRYMLESKGNNYAIKRLALGLPLLQQVYKYLRNLLSRFQS